MHGDLAADRVEHFLVAVRRQRDENAELADAVAGSVVDVGRDRALRHFEQDRTAQRHVLADGGDRVGDAVLDGLARCRIVRGGNRFDLAVGVKGNSGDAANEILESFVAGNEVGLGIDFDDDSLVATRCNADQAFSRGAARLLLGLGNALGAQPIDRGFHVATGLGQRLLAVHHARAGALAQNLDHFSCNSAHFKPLYVR